MNAPAVRLLAAVVALTLGIAAVGVVVAHADGDPASDFLLSQQSFLSPYDGHVQKSEADRLNAMLASASKQGFPLKVAVIATRYDLGAVPILFRKPQTYAKFLAEEDYFIWKNELLVVMPNGYGIYRAKGTPPADKVVIAKLPKVSTTDGTKLVQAAQQAVAALAQRRGITLATSGGSSGGPSVWVERGEIAAGVVVLGLLALGGRWVWRRRRT
jgi:hypothetical protein